MMKKVARLSSVCLAEPLGPRNRGNRGKPWTADADLLDRAWISSCARVLGHKKLKLVQRRLCERARISCLLSRLIYSTEHGFPLVGVLLDKSNESM
jgi:hypothetical protein